jgi:integrase
MPPEPALAPLADDHVAAFERHLRRRGLRGTNERHAARRFLGRWPDPAAWAAEPLEVRLRSAAHPATNSFLRFCMFGGRLRPGLDLLVARRLPSFWREMAWSPIGPDVRRYLGLAEPLGFTARGRHDAASQVIGRLLIETGRPLDALTEADFAALAAACRARAARTGRSWHHYEGAIHAARQVLFHAGILADPPPNSLTRFRQSFGERLRDVPVALRPTFVAYLGALLGTHERTTITGIASRLTHFGRHLALIDPDLRSLAELDRRRHVEPYLAVVAAARSSRSGLPISASERRGRVLAVHGLLDRLTEWGWPEAPPRRLLFARDIPKLPRDLPRYLPPDIDRRLVAALEASPDRLYADALLLQRATGLRIGELVDLELDCIHEIPDAGAWLKVPLGKLDSERMVPLDEDTVGLVDRIVEERSAGRPLPHPRTGRPVDFLLMHHGHRVSPDGLRDELARAAASAGLPHVTPHQLRHTYATALVNAGVSLQSLMALLGHRTAEMSLRYGRLFDATVRAEYERALELAKTRYGSSLPVVPLAEPAGDWRELPVIKARLAGGYCLRTEAQGVCPYTNICEHCPSLRTEATFLPILATQRADASALAADAARRGWGEEAERHRRLIERLDALMARAAAS